MKNLKYLIVTFLILLSANSNAGWWIFGNSKAEIDYKYLTFNGVNWDELDSSIKVYPDMLPNGIMIEGKALVSKGKIGSVRVSTKKGKWFKADVANDGAFKYLVKTRPGDKFDLRVEISDTAGKTNDVSSTLKTVTITTIQAKVAVDNILKAINRDYKSQNVNAVMKSVSKHFLGDVLMLEDAIRGDFSLFNSTKIDITPVSYSFSDDLRILVDIKFIRSLISKTSGKLLTDSGLTRFTFKLGQNNLELYSMQFPIIFGVSDAGNIATGFVNPGGNPNTIVVTDDDTKVVPYNNAVILVGSGASVITGIVSVTSSDSGIDTLSFGSESVSRESHNETNAVSYSDIETGDIAIGHLRFRGKEGTTIKQLVGTDPNTFSTVPTSGYVSASGFNHGGSVYAIRTKLGKYAIIGVSGFSYSYGTTRYTITYKFQTNGTNQF